MGLIRAIRVKKRILTHPVNSVQNSGFEFRISFGLRISPFGFENYCLSRFILFRRALLSWKYMPINPARLLEVASLPGRRLAIRASNPIKRLVIRFNTGKSLAARPPQA